VLRVVAILSLPAAGLIACSTAPSTAGSTYSDSGRLTGELEVYAEFVLAGAVDSSLPRPGLPPGSYTARLDKLQRDELVIDVDAPEFGDLIVRLREGAGEFPVGNGGFSFPASQHDLPYTIYGEHVVTRSVQSTTRYLASCRLEVLRESCYTTDEGETSCALVAVTVNGWQPMERRITLEGEDLGLTFVDAEAAAVVARYFAVIEPRLEERLTPEGSCREYR
jgi:hypothetical protein